MVQATESSPATSSPIADPAPEQPTEQHSEQTAPDTAAPLPPDDATAGEEQAPAPTSTLAQANKTLAAFGSACRDQADANYRLAALAADYVQQFLGSAPGKATRGVAVERLASEWLQWDEDSLATPQAQALRRLRERVNVLLRGNAVATLLGDGRGVSKGDGTAKGRGRGSREGRIAWGTLRELCPLVSREDNDHAETWHVLPSVAEDARKLVAEVATSGMARADVVLAVAKLMVRDAEQERDAARREGDAGRIKRAEEAVVRWGGKVERAEEPAPATGAGAPAPSGEAGGDVAPPAPPAEARQGTNLLASARNGAPKDVADMAVELITGGEAPDDVLTLVLKALDGHGELCAASHRAIKAALVVIERAARPQQGATTNAA